MMGFHGYSISDIFDLYERHFGGAHHCFCSHSAMYYGIHGVMKLGVPGAIWSPRMDRILCDSTALPAWPVPGLGVGGLFRRHCFELESGL